MGDCHEIISSEEVSSLVVDTSTVERDTHELAKHVLIFASVRGQLLAYDRRRHQLTQIVSHSLVTQIIDCGPIYVVRTFDGQFYVSESAAEGEVMTNLRLVPWAVNIDSLTATPEAAYAVTNIGQLVVVRGLMSISSTPEYLTFPFQVHSVHALMDKLLILTVSGEVLEQTSHKQLKFGKKGGRVLKLAVGRAHALVLTDKKRVWSWGANDQGQCGVVVRAPFLKLPKRAKLNSNQSSERHIKHPHKIKELAQITEIVVHSDSSYVLDTNGQAWAWGANDQGQLALGDLTNRPKPELLNLGVVTKISVAYHGLVFHGREQKVSLVFFCARGDPFVPRDLCQLDLAEVPYAEA